MLSTFRLRTRLTRRSPQWLIVCIALWMFQVAIGQPLSFCCQGESQGSESEKRCEADEIGGPQHLSNNLRRRSREEELFHIGTLSDSASHRAALVAGAEPCCIALRNPARALPLRC
jgi:hypothetical protein